MIAGFLQRLNETGMSREDMRIAIGELEGDWPFAKVANLLLKGDNVTTEDAIDLIRLMEDDVSSTARRPYQRQPREKKYGPRQDPDAYMSAEKLRAYNFGYYLGASDILTPRLPERDWLPLVGQVFRRDEWTCTYCGADGEEYALHCDHIVPISRGGTNDLDNLTTACDYCNCSKRDAMPHEWRPLRGLPVLVE